jgi:signal peptidase I
MRPVARPRTRRDGDPFDNGWFAKPPKPPGAAGQGRPANGRQPNDQVNGRADGAVNGQANGRVNGQANGRVNGQVNGRAKDLPDGRIGDRRNASRNGIPPVQPPGGQPSGHQPRPVSRNNLPPAEPPPTRGVPPTRGDTGRGMPPASRNNLPPVERGRGGPLPPGGLPPGGLPPRANPASRNDLPPTRGDGGSGGLPPRANPASRNDLPPRVGPASRNNLPPARGVNGRGLPPGVNPASRNNLPPVPGRPTGPSNFPPGNPANRPPAPDGRPANLSNFPPGHPANRDNVNPASRTNVTPLAGDLPSTANPISRNDGPPTAIIPAARVGQDRRDRDRDRPPVVDDDDAPTDPGPFSRVAFEPRRPLRPSGLSEPDSPFDLSPPDEPDTDEAPKKKRKKLPFWVEVPLLIVVALLLTFSIQTFVARVYVIPSGSMEMTLIGNNGTGDRILVDKVVYNFHAPRPGDVVVFKGPPGWDQTEFFVDTSTNPVLRWLHQLASSIGIAKPDEYDLVKRVVAVGGQTISCCDPQNRMIVDGKPLTEPYVYWEPDRGGPAQQLHFGPVTIPQGDLWVMGDNRNNSDDSRFQNGGGIHGVVPVANVIGKARTIIWPPSRWRGIGDFNAQAAAGVADGAPSWLGTVPATGFGVLAAMPTLWFGRRFSKRLRDAIR